MLERTATRCGHRRTGFFVSGAVAVAIALSACAGSPDATSSETADRVAQVRLTDGSTIEGTLRAATLAIRGEDGAARSIAAGDLLSFHRAAATSAWEDTRIVADLAQLDATDVRTTEAAVAELTDIGLPAITPLLRSFEDRDGHEPDPRYRLFARLIPGRADRMDRGADLIRLADGSALRGHVDTPEFRVDTPDGASHRIPIDQVRRLAIRRAHIEKTFELDAMRDCTYVAFLDTGVALTSGSSLRSDADGFVRLSYDEDGWATDPDGIHDPLPGKRRLQEGFRWGSILGRVGTEGERWFAGRHLEKAGLPAGRLYYAINDNEHWQNTVGSFRVLLTATDAYDLGDPR